jgi:hypothetical protein
MKINCWTQEGFLNFNVYLKLNQKLNYLNKGSAHTKACFRAISVGVTKRLSKLTTRTRENEDTPIDKVYLEHFKALKDANVIGSETKILTLGQLNKKLQVEKEQKGELTKRRKQRERDRKRVFFFKVGVSNLWKNLFQQLSRESKASSPQ